MVSNPTTWAYASASVHTRAAGSLDKAVENRLDCNPHSTKHTQLLAAGHARRKNTRRVTKAEQTTREIMTLHLPGPGQSPAWRPVPTQTGTGRRWRPCGQCGGSRQRQHPRRRPSETWLMTGVGREEPVVERAERVRKGGEKAKESGCVEDKEMEDSYQGRRRLCGKGAGRTHAGCGGERCRL